MLLTAHNGWFLLALSLMLVHELDAVRCHEWRIFPILEKIDDDAAMRWYILLHIPVLVFVLWFSFEAIRVGGNSFSATFLVFCVLHAFLHWLYERHPRCEFRNWQSRSIIWSCAGAGVIGFVFHPLWN